MCDNASEDNSEEVVKSFKKKYPNIRLKYIKHPYNIGMVANWRSCLDNASGDYVMILCDDDYLSSNNYLSEVAELISKNPDVVLITTNFTIKYPNKEIENNINLPYIVEGKEAYLKYFDKKYVGAGFFFCFYKYIYCDNSYLIHKRS